jgi:hypothetical protein
MTAKSETARVIAAKELLAGVYGKVPEAPPEAVAVIPSQSGQSRCSISKTSDGLIGPIGGRGGAASREDVSPVSQKWPKSGVIGATYPHAQ